MVPYRAVHLIATPTLQSSGYRVVLLLGKLRPQYSYAHTKKCATPIMGFIGLAIALPPPSVHEVRRARQRLKSGKMILKGTGGMIFKRITNNTSLREQIKHGLKILH